MDSIHLETYLVVSNVELEKKFWIQSYLPTGKYKSRAVKSRAIHPDSYDELLKLHKSGRGTREIARSFGCSASSVSSTLKSLLPK